MTTVISTKFNHIKAAKIGYAKPSLEHVLSFGKGKLSITGSTMDLLMFISPYVDFDGRIVIPMEEVRQRVFIQHKTFYHALYSALNKGLLYKHGEYYYSRFHVHSTGENFKADYLKLLKVYTSSTLFNYSLNKKRLFYYFASVTTIGTWQRIRVENLYKNELHHPQHGVSYFSSFKEMAGSLLTLVRDGLLEIKLRTTDGSKALLLHAETPNIEEIFFNHFDCQNGQRKARTSSLKSAKHTISVRVSPLLSSKDQELIVQASNTELCLLAEANQLDWEELRTETKNYIIGYKNELYSVAGNTGLSIYREALHTYISEFGAQVLHFDLVKNKAANFFMDFYLLPSIKKHLLAAACHPNIMTGRTVARDILGNNKLLPLHSLDGLVEFYLHHGSLSHKVTLQQDLENKGLPYRSYTVAHRQWQQLHLQTATLYTNIPKEYEELMNVTEWKRFIYERATKQLYRDQEAFIEMATAYLRPSFNQKETIPSPDTITSKVEARVIVPFYNWLEDTE